VHHLSAGPPGSSGFLRMPECVQKPGSMPLKLKHTGGPRVGDTEAMPSASGTILGRSLPVSQGADDRSLPSDPVRIQTEPGPP
jgi:hypothetical protein